MGSTWHQAYDTLNTLLLCCCCSTARVSTYEYAAAVKAALYIRYLKLPTLYRSTPLYLDISNTSYSTLCFVYEDSYEALVAYSVHSVRTYSVRYYYPNIKLFVSRTCNRRRRRIRTSIRVRHGGSNEFLPKSRETQQQAAHKHGGFTKLQIPCNICFVSYTAAADIIGGFCYEFLVYLYSHITRALQASQQKNTHLHSRSSTLLL